MRKTTVGVAGLAAGLFLTAAPAGAVVFNFTPTGNAQADAGYVQAGQLWSNLLTDNITINITTGFSNLGTGTIANAGSQTVGAFYTDVRTALTADATTSHDAVAVANLPVGTPGTYSTPQGVRTLHALSFISNNEATGARELDNNQTANNLALDINRANAKALGLLAAHDTGEDASLTFNSSFKYDFNRGDGIASDSFDFVGVAAHEIAHALGFVSGVDLVDYFSKPNGPASPSENDPFRVHSVLDLFRYSADAIAAGGDVLDLAYGGTPFFSLNGATNQGAFSTGDFNGDGNQASHWKDNQGIGIMDPTLGFGELANITNADRMGMDAIGYNLVVPEPSSLALLGLGALALARRRRRA